MGVPHPQTLHGLILALLVEVLLYVHRKRRFIRDGRPRRPPRLSHTSWALMSLSLLCSLLNPQTLHGLILALLWSLPKCVVGYESPPQLKWPGLVLVTDGIPSSSSFFLFFFFFFFCSRTQCRNRRDVCLRRHWSWDNGQTTIVPVAWIARAVFINRGH